MSLVPQLRHAPQPVTTQLSPIEQNEKLKKEIQQALSARPDQTQRDTSRFLEASEASDSGKLYKPTYGKNAFQARDPEMNRLPLFYSKEDTEIASSEAIKTLSTMQKAMASIRLIAKRFINAETGLSLDGSGKKGNPPLHEQRMSFRAIRSEAATATVASYNGRYIKDLYDHILSQIDFSKITKKPVTVHLIRPARDPLAADATVNFLSLTAQTEVTDSLNYLAKIYKDADKIRFSNKQALDERYLSVLSRTARSNASPLGRIVQQGFYENSGVEPGDLTVIVDDHSQAGATILSRASALKQKGAKVLAAITPTVHPFSKKLDMSPAVKRQLSKILKEWDPQNKLTPKLESLGMPLNTLTDHEAMIIIAYATDPKNKTQCEEFEQLEQSLTGQGSVLEGDSDSLKPVLAQAPLPVDDLLLEMDNEIEKNRQVTIPLKLDSIHVLDWDDFLRDEKGLNYRLMHNAVAKAAIEHGRKYPFLVRLNQALSAKRGHYEADKGMPLLSMTQEQLQAATIGNPKFLKRDAIDDLLTHLDGLELSLQKAFSDITFSQADLPNQAQKAINNILWHTFRRQYQAAIKSAPRPVENLPFQDTRPHLMPGAMAFLNKLHRPENFISLISNRPHADLEKEINQMGLAHYFDDVQGTPSVLTGTGEKATLSDPRFKKPNPHRLQLLLEQHPMLKKVTKWHFWGDTPKDISQAFGFLHANKALQQHQVQGSLVNPNQFLLGKLRNQLDTENLSEVVSLDSRATLEQD